MLLNIVEIRLASDAGMRLSVWPARVRGGLLRLMKALATRPASTSPTDFSLHVLKDIGLSRSDLPAIRAGLIDDDDTRRKR